MNYQRIYTSRRRPREVVVAVGSGHGKPRRAPPLVMGDGAAVVARGEGGRRRQCSRGKEGGGGRSPPSLFEIKRKSKGIGGNDFRVRV